MRPESPSSLVEPKAGREVNSIRKMRVNLKMKDIKSKGQCTSSSCAITLEIWHFKLSLLAHIMSALELSTACWSQTAVLKG